MIYVGIDDTDVVGSPGTKRLARELVYDLLPDYQTVVAVRHQLLFDRRVPYTSKNSSVSLLIQSHAAEAIPPLAARIRAWLRERFVEGSDPGLCLAAHVPAAIVDFGRRCQRDVVEQREACRAASQHGVWLEPLGGTGDGVIGALAAVGLLAQGHDGRVVQIGQWPDDLSGPQEIGVLRARGLREICRVDSGLPVQQGVVDVGKHFRPNYRDFGVVLYVEPCNGGDQPAAWRAVRLT